MKIREKAVEALVQNGMFEDQAAEIIEMYLKSSLGKMVRERFDDEESDYPPELFVAVWFGIKKIALQWIDEKKPKHWARPIFAE